MKRLVIAALLQIVMVAQPVKAENWTLDLTRMLNKSMIQAQGTVLSDEITLSNVLVNHFGNKITIVYKYETKYVEVYDGETNKIIASQSQFTCNKVAPTLLAFDNVSEVKLAHQFQLDELAGFEIVEFAHKCK
ncbi:hypothetical protein BIZ37_27615 [Photobacterium sp. BZF1]|uniref:hypothetical protein n=1 Tax=Photobacterium sp. BZF1 TaxID=1904457 RepID=UPI0016534D40|nr:hypothetical protein [Photobacterium sp. BZF1]MBC7006330.1 hypothetical protein [Photobacterium sp. BZF1]